MQERNAVVGSGATGFEANEPETTGAEAPVNVGLVSGLFDWRFRHYLTMQLLPVFYVLLILAAVVVIAGIVGIAFLIAPLAGLIALGISPFVLLISVAVIRAVLEYLVMAHRIMRVVENMERIPRHVDRLSDRVDLVVDRVDGLGERVEHIHETVTMLRPLLAPSRMSTRLWRAVRERLQGPAP